MWKSDGKRKRTPEKKTRTKLKKWTHELLYIVSPIWHRWKVFGICFQTIKNAAICVSTYIFWWVAVAIWNSLKLIALFFILEQSMLLLLLNGCSVCNHFLMSCGVSVWVWEVAKGERERCLLTLFKRIFSAHKGFVPIFFFRFIFFHSTISLGNGVIYNFSLN